MFFLLTLLFPFVKGTYLLFTAAHLSVNLWKEDVPIVEPNCLRLLACLCYAGFKQYSIQHDAGEDHEEMRKIVVISTDTDSKDEEIERLTILHQTSSNLLEPLQCG